LAQFEAEATTRRIVELIARPVNGPFDVAHLKAVHRHVFQDVYSWAGQFRTINISKAGHLFGAAAFLERSLASLFQRLARENHLKGAASDAFVKRAFYLGEINAAHPFREGNGRAQREFGRRCGLCDRLATLQPGTDDRGLTPKRQIRRERRIRGDYPSLSETLIASLLRLAEQAIEGGAGVIGITGRRRVRRLAVGGQTRAGLRSITGHRHSGLEKPAFVGLILHRDTHRDRLLALEAGRWIEVRALLATMQCRSAFGTDAAKIGVGRQGGGAIEAPRGGHGLHQPRQTRTGDV
jgi:hypothetical protein